MEEVEAALVLLVSMESMLPMLRGLSVMKSGISWAIMMLLHSKRKRDSIWTW
jgi:hypothetical protein